MQKPTKFIHDRLVLFLLTVNTFLTMLCAILVLLRLDNRVNGYIVEYRASRGINAYKTGDTSELIALILFAVIILVINTAISWKAYSLHKHFSFGILSLGTLLILISIIVSNALIILK